MIPTFTYNSTASYLPEKEIDLTLAELCTKPVTYKPCPKRKTQGKIIFTIKELVCGLLAGLSLLGTIWALYMLMWIFS